MLDYVIIFPFAYGGKIQNKNIDGKNVMFHFEIDSTDEIDLETNITVLILLRFTNILQKLKEYESSQPISTIDDQDLIEFIKFFHPNAITINQTNYLIQHIENILAGIDLGVIRAIVSKIEKFPRKAALSLPHIKKFYEGQIIRIDGLINKPELNGAIGRIMKEWEFSKLTLVNLNGTPKTFKIKNIVPVLCHCGEIILNDYRNCSLNCKSIMHQECLKKIMTEMKVCGCGKMYKTLDIHFSRNLSEKQCEFYMKERKEYLELLIKVGIILGDPRVDFRSLKWNQERVSFFLRMNRIKIELCSDNECVVIPETN